MMDREDLRNVLVSLLEEEMDASYDLRDDNMELREGLGLDSVDVVGLVMRVERQFRIRLTMEELMDIKSVGQLLELVGSKIDSKDAGSPLNSPGMNEAEAA